MQKAFGRTVSARQKAMGVSVGPKGSMSLFELIFIGVGGIIGAGFFLGSGLPIRQAGPSVLLAFALGAVLTSQVIGSLNTVAVDHPTEGAFMAYAEMYLNSYFGYMQGWLYYIASLLTISSEAVASAIFVKMWLPSWPLWLLAGIFAAVVIVINAFGVRNFSVIESFMSVLKLAALVGFIAFAAVAIFGAHGVVASRPSASLAALHHGFFTHGVSGFFASMLVVIFAYAGIGVFSTASVELKRPSQIDAGGIAVIVMLAVLYLLSIGAVLLFVPTSSVPTDKSPFVYVLQQFGSTALGNVLNAIILIAAFSVMAAAVFSSNQILAYLGQRGDAPHIVTRSGKKKPVHYAALGMTTVGIGLLIALSSILPSNVYQFLVSGSSFFTFFNWIVILVTFVAWRRKNPERPTSRLAIGGTVGAFITMGIFVLLAAFAVTSREQRIGFEMCIAIAFLVTLGYVWKRRTMRHRDGAHGSK